MLCETCKRFFSGNLDIIVTKESVKNVHHKTFKSMLWAVEQKCYICHSVWLQLTKAQRSWLQGDYGSVIVATWYTLEQGYKRL